MLGSTVAAALRAFSPSFRIRAEIKKRGRTATAV